MASELFCKKFAQSDNMKAMNNPKADYSLLTLKSFVS